MSPKFDALEEIAQGTFDVTLPDGTAWKGAIVTPDIRRELQKVDVGVAENASRISAQARAQRDDPGSYDASQLEGTYKDVNTVQDAVYAKLRILLRGESDKRPTQQQVIALGDVLAAKLLTQLNGGDEEEAPPTPPAGTTGT